MFLKTSQYSQENRCGRFSLLIKLQAWAYNFIKKRDPGPKKKQSCFLKSAVWKFSYQLPGHLIEYVSEYTFLISKNNSKQQKKQTKQTKKQEPKKAKETKEEKRIPPENRLKKLRPPGEDFSRQTHFRKQEYYFFFGPGTGVFLWILQNF